MNSIVMHFVAGLMVGVLGTIIALIAAFKKR